MTDQDSKAHLDPLDPRTRRRGGWRWFLTIPHPARAWRFVLLPVVDRIRDKLTGLDTAAGVRHKDLGFGPERGTEYMASYWNTLGKILDRSQVSEKDVFLDVGCGKGAVLCQATRYPFARVIGVELSPELCSIARTNVDRFTKTQNNPRVQIYEADAAQWQIPDDVTVVFLFNPFLDSVFDSFMDRLGESSQRQPRDITLVYLNPMMHTDVLARGFVLERRAKFVSQPPSYAYLYRNTSS